MLHADDVLVPLHLKSNEFIIVVRPVLGLTMYLDGPDAWATEHARDAYLSFLDAVPAEKLGFFTTHLLRRWQRIDHPRDYVEELSSVKLALDGPRHLFSFTIADYPNTPELSFHYTEVDPRRSDRTSVLQITLPFDSDPDELLQLGLRFTNLGPVHSMVGGYGARWHKGHQRLAFDHFYLWAQRFVGLDVQDPSEAALTAREGLHGVNWLTFVGNELAARKSLDLSSIATHQFVGDVKAFPTSHGMLLRAGVRPTVGDLNELEFPRDYAEVARLLDGAMTPTAVRHWGFFFEDDRSLLWRRRFVDPHGWPIQ